MDGFLLVYYLILAIIIMSMFIVHFKKAEARNLRLEKINRAMEVDNESGLLIAKRSEIKVREKAYRG